MNNFEMHIPAFRQRNLRQPFPRWTSLTDCGFLFSRFRELILASRRVGVVGVYLPSSLWAAGNGARVLSIFLRKITGKLRGTIEGGYQANEQEFFFLLAPEGDYGDDEFSLDMERARGGLKRHLRFLGRKECESDPLEEDMVRVDGVILINQPGETTDNALFRAFQELFGATSPASRRAAEERDEIRRIISSSSITPVYQPIFSLSNGTVHGHEALSRVTGPLLFGNIEILFDKAQEHNLAEPLDMLCRRKALEKAAALGMDGRLFLNVSPTLLTDRRHRPGSTAELLRELGIDRSRITFEITEKALISDYGLFRKLVDHYRNQGYSVAIDDLGSGYAGLGMLTEVIPDYVKLARFLVAGIDGSPPRQALLDSLVSFCGKIGAQVIAEGIERQEELDHLIRAGVTLGQGYLLAKPSAAPFLQVVNRH